MPTIALRMADHNIQALPQLVLGTAHVIDSWLCHADTDTAAIHLYNRTGQQSCAYLANQLCVLSQLLCHHSP